MSGSLEPTAVVHLSPGLSPLPHGLRQPIGKFGFIVNCRFFFLGGAGSGLQERFRSLTRAVDRNAPANKPAAGHLMMADADKVQMARRGPGIHWGRCTAQWRCSQWNAQDRHTTWAARPMNRFLTARITSPPFIPPADFNVLSFFLFFFF